ncbi:MAG: pilus assembly protein TadG-related protein [Deltaproteobacteria bacterium]|nr:pilus assembly protein TadG-related protein [Deltaproteobacteria bacterium]
MPEQPESFWRSEKGAVALTAAICLTALLAAAGLVIDLGHYYLVRQQLKNAADAGALAGVRAIFPYDLKSASLPLEPRCSFAITTGTATAQSNRTDALSPGVSYIQTGKWDWQKRELVPCCSSDPAGFPNAVTVTTQRADVPLYFMQMFGAKPKTLAATSTAVMDWVKSLKPHKGLGLAIGKDWYKEEAEIEIALNDDSNDKGGWYAFPPNKPNDELLTNWLTGQELIPFTTAGDYVYLQNGVMHTVLDLLKQGSIGEAFPVPVVDEVKFNQTAQVVGFTLFTITAIKKVNGKHIVVGKTGRLGEVSPELGLPGGENFGLLTNAKLVQ